MCVIWKSHCLILLHILRIWHNELSCAPLIRHFVFIELCTTELVNMKMIRYQYQDKFRYKTLTSKWIIFGYLSWRELCSRSHRTWYCYVIILIISTPTPHLTRPGFLLLQTVARLRLNDWLFLELKTHSHQSCPAFSLPYQTPLLWNSLQKCCFRHQSEYLGNLQKTGD